LDLLDKLPLKSTRAGNLCHRLLQFYFRQQRQIMGRETIPLSAPVVVQAAIDPELFTWEEMAADVELAGELTRGATIFDQRSPREWSINMDVATACNDPEAIQQQVLRSLKHAGQVT
jgi:inosine-uridine nucleoside N-ribohydrolase